MRSFGFIPVLGRGRLAGRLARLESRFSSSALWAFGCTVRFSQAQNRIYFPGTRVPLKTADIVTYRRVRTALAEQGAAVSCAGELEVRLAQALSGRLAAPPTLSEIAQSIGMSERTLRRRLTELGQSYAEILDRERRDRALALIRGGQLAFDAIATAAGFSGARSLRRAVLRWTAKTPSELRPPR